MLPGFRLVAVAIVATMLLVVLGLGQLVKLQEAQSRAASLPSPDARLAALAFAEGGDWRPIATTEPMSLETMPPFDGRPGRFAPSEDQENSAAKNASIVQTANSPEEPLPLRASGAVAAPGDTAVGAVADASVALASVRQEPGEAQPIAQDEQFQPVQADGAPLAIAAAIGPAAVDPVSSPPLEAAPAAVTAMRAPATSATAAPDTMPVTILVSESASVTVSPTTSKPEAAKVTATTALPISRSDVKVPIERPRRPAAAKPSHAPGAHRHHPKPAPRVHAKPSNLKKLSRAVRTATPVAPAATAQVRPQPTDPFTALFGGSRAPANARN